MKANEAEIKLLELRIPSCADRLKLVRSVVNCAAQMFGFKDEEVDSMVLAVNEACMNIMQHAYCGCDGEIILEIIDKHDELLFRLTDFAETVNKANIKPRDLSDLRPGGLGVHLMQEVMDRVSYFDGPDNTGNIVELSKKLKQREGV